ncbi:MAG: GNAT family N-acetyltransferase [Anaerolineae bacterium]|jgi:mycothiol synthase
MSHDIQIRNFRSEDLPALVDLINQADAVDGLERATTPEEMDRELSWPNYQADTDCFLAWAGGRLVGYADFFLRNNGNSRYPSIFYSEGVVHPRWRRQGLGRRLMDTLFRRADARLAEIEQGPVYFQVGCRQVEPDRRALFQGLGLARVRYFVNMDRPIDNGLPSVDLPDGFRLRPFDLERDAETVWRVDTEAFQDHWGYTGFPLEEFLHWLEQPNFRPELCVLAEEEGGGQVVGIGLNKIDPKWIAKTGRQEGYINTLAVLRPYRGRGLGTALLAQSLRTLRQAGMSAAHLTSDAENLTGAMRIYQGVGFAPRKTFIVYRKTMRSA